MISFGAVKLKLYKKEKLPHVCPLSNTHGQNSATPSFCKLIESSCEWSSQNSISLRLSSSLKKILLFNLYKSTTSFINQNPTPKQRQKTGLQSSNHGLSGSNQLFWNFTRKHHWQLVAHPPSVVDVSSPERDQSCMVETHVYIHYDGQRTPLLDTTWEQHDSFIMEIVEFNIVAS